MATEIIVQKFGSTPAYVTAESSHTYINDGQTTIYVQSFHGASLVYTQIEQETCDFEHAHINDAFTVQSGGVSRVWLALNRYRYNDKTGLAHFTLSEITNVWVAAISQTPQES